MNFFVYQTVAERYAKYRPYFHPIVMDKIKSYLQMRDRVSIAVDVGCGPGQSTVALKEIAEVVIGVDISQQMLALAKNDSRIGYINASAETIAITNDSADLLTTSLAYHWFNQEQFFAEARRILKQGAWLVIYNNGFTGRMKENEAFENWAAEIYVKRYPIPPRNSSPITTEFSRRHGFHFAHQEDYQNNVQFRLEELAGYLITQSNVIAATEQGNENVEDVYRWLLAQIRPFFHSENEIFIFDGYIWYFKKT